ncbi:MAG: PTS system trehalose-specific EIIBC component [Corynebacterium sp.]|nr:PTS system trehalose-specific EIIBC component [Corynebacterium sp.]
MGKFHDDAERLLSLVGGKENISAVTHCMTRMRFVLVDPKKADEKAIEELESVKGTFTQAGQYQVIIGNEVDVFYKEFTDIAGIEGVSKEAVKAAAKSNQNVAQRIVGTLGEIFAPIIPALICGGLILGFRNVIGEIGFFEGDQSLADKYQFWAGMYSFLWLIGEAVFHMLPVGIVWSITRKMGTTQILGIVLGLTLVSPQLLNGFKVADTPADQIPTWDFGFMHVQMIGYQGQVISAILAGFVLVYLERFFKKICPEVISMIVVPLCALLPAVIIAHTIVGPIGWTIGNALGHFVYSALFSPFKLVFALFFGIFYAPLVMTGLHHMTNAVDTQLVTQFNGTPLWPMIALSNIAQGSAVLGMVIAQRKNQRAQQVNIPACISAYLGVTEPALFGVNLKYKYPLICGMIGSGLAALVAVSFGTEAVSIGVGGLPGILSIKPEYWVPFLLAMVVAIVVPCVLTVIVASRKLREEASANAEEISHESEQTVLGAEAHAEGGVLTLVDTTTAVAMMDGEIMDLSQVADPAFAAKALGDGLAIEPSGNMVYAPCNAKVVAAMTKTGHAVGLKLNNGLQLLIHVGIDTVSMNGDGFQMFVNKGDIVQAGQPLIQFDPEKIHAAGHPATTMLIVVKEGEAKDLNIVTSGTAIAKETPVITWA